MPKLSSLLAASGTVLIANQGDEDDPLRVTYRRDIMTPRLQGEMAVFQTVKDGDANAAEAMAFYCSLLSKLIEAWNLTDVDGSVIGTDAEALQDVPFDLLNRVMTAIGEAMAPDPLKAAGSNNGSSPTADSEPRQIGMAS